MFAQRKNADRSVTAKKIASSQATLMTLQHKFQTFVELSKPVKGWLNVRIVSLKISTALIENGHVERMLLDR